MSKSQQMENHVIAMIYNKTKNDPILSAEIERRLDISGGVVRDIVHRARTEQNLPICAESKGYFMPRDKVEALRTIKSLKSRAKHNNEAADGIEMHYAKDDQIRLL